MISFLALILPGLVVAYALFLRPYLVAHFKDFFTRANGFWEKVWALCGNSAVLAWSYVVQLVGQALQWIDPIANMLGDPDFRAQMTETLGANPKVLGYVLMGVSAITIVARLRSFLKAD